MVFNEFKFNNIGEKTVEMQEVAGWRGRFFEDFQVGDIYKHPLGRTITQTDNTWFTLLTMNTNELHFNVEYGNQA